MLRLNDQFNDLVSTDKQSTDQQQSLEKIIGIVSRITYFNEQSGWSVLRLTPLEKGRTNEVVTVTVHQSKVFAGATMEFQGHWVSHPQYGQQFKAVQATERKPASSAALEKYLGSGLIYGVGPKTAKRIVKYFGKDTLDVFEENIERLTEVKGIAQEKLKMISSAWKEHRDIRDVMIFLQSHGISTLFAVKIYKRYGTNAIHIVQDNPYRLSKDIYGIGFFSADKVALSMGIALDGPKRTAAAIGHVLASSREEGHCFLTLEQIIDKVNELLALKLDERIEQILVDLVEQQEICSRQLKLRSKDGVWVNTKCFYNKTLFFDEKFVADKVKELLAKKIEIDEKRVENWLDHYSKLHGLQLSDEQNNACKEIVKYNFSILTGGPGCGKTTTTKVLVKLITAMNKKILLAAPTGRAAQRMSEVIGLEAKTIHRLLVWNPQNGRFKQNEENPLDCEFLIVDECSMLDISLTANLLKAIPANGQVLFIGDSDQLPSVGAGNVLKDLLSSKKIPHVRLSKIFRQAEESSIIKYAHEINKGLTPKVPSPLRFPEMWSQKQDALFIDAEEMTQEQAKFIARAKHFFVNLKNDTQQAEGLIKKLGKEDQIKQIQKIYQSKQGEFLYEDLDPINSEEELDKDQNRTIYNRFELKIPKKFFHVDIDQLLHQEKDVELFKSVLKKIHPWSSLHYGKTALDMIERIYLQSIPQYYGHNTEIQILSPMTKGSLGTLSLNKKIQQIHNPPSPDKSEIQLSGRIFRTGDRVIQKRNNYDLGVFNGDIGKIEAVNSSELSCLINFGSKGIDKIVHYEKDNLAEIDLAYAITIHKSQGSEFDAVIIPVATQHFKMLHRNLIYTGLTRAKKLCIFVGTRKALGMAVRNNESKVRQTGLINILR